jgi:hypothetical protein
MVLAATSMRAPVLAIALATVVRSSMFTFMDASMLGDQLMLTFSRVMSPPMADLIKSCILSEIPAFVRVCSASIKSGNFKSLFKSIIALCHA